MAEFWDAYDENFNKISGMKLLRGEKICDGIFHLVADVVVKHADGTYLLMQRDPKKHLGLMWEATAGGSALLGESPLDCAKRELKEETGIESTIICEIGRLVHKEYQTLYVEYLCITDCSKNSIVLQQGETVDYKWVSSNELKQMSSVLASTRFQNFLDK